MEEKKEPKLQSGGSQQIRIEPPKKNDVEKTPEQQPVATENINPVGEDLSSPDVTSGAMQIEPSVQQDKGLSPIWFGLLGVSGVLLLAALYILMKQFLNIGPIGLLKPIMKVVGG